MLTLEEVCSTNYRRLELKSYGPLSIWLHYYGGTHHQGFYSKINISTTFFYGRLMTFYVHTSLAIRVPLPIWVPSFVRILITEEYVTLHIPKHTKIRGNDCCESSTTPTLDESLADLDRIIVVRCADVRKFDDVIEFTPAENAVIFAEGGRNHIINNESASTKVIEH